MQTTKWGYGRAVSLAPSTKAETEVVCWVSDVHVPYQDDALVDSAVRFIRKHKPDRIVLNGDFSDFFTISRFNSGAERLDSLQEEIDQANEIRKRIRKAAPNAHIVECPGNHCIRITRYIAENARAITSLRALEPSKLFMHQELEIQPVSDAGFLLRPNFLSYHGTVLRKHGGWSAKGELEKNGISGCSGHTHRLATFTQSGYQNQSWTEGGGLFRLDADYLIGVPNWQRGMVIGQFSTKTTSFAAECIPEHDGGLFYGGKVY